VPACPGGARTTVSGQIFDPAGKTPLYNITVFVPNAPLDDIKDGPSCDPCDPVTGTSLLSGQPIVVTKTDVTGTFHLGMTGSTDVPSGTDVPLVIPEVNGDHLALIDGQRRKRGWSGAIVTNANCSATVAVVALAPLHQKFGIKQLFLSTMQAVSGAGYPGVPSLDILGNVIPYIADEEPKLEREMLKLLGTYEDDEIIDATFKVSAHTNRVPVEHGHTICMTIGFEEKPTPEAAIQTMRDWKGFPATEGLPTRPEHPLVVTDAPDRPQPKRDVSAGDGMTVTVGRVRRDAVLDLRMVALGHNTVRGAAGGSVLNAELLAVNGALDSA
jgi:aspartate-semialdehyde dehydrogenase